MGILTDNKFKLNTKFSLNISNPFSKKTNGGQVVENNDVEFNNVVLDESVLAQNIDNIEIVKEEVKEEVSFAVEKIPVVIKPRKKRGRPKKKH